VILDAAVEKLELPTKSNAGRQAVNDEIELPMIAGRQAVTAECPTAEDLTINDISSKLTIESLVQ
jgi:hypothetical protein